MFVPLGNVAWTIVVGLPRRPFSDRQRRQSWPFGRMPAPTVAMDRATADMGGSGDLGDERALGAEPAHGDHGLGGQALVDGCHG